MHFKRQTEISFFACRANLIWLQVLLPCSPVLCHIFLTLKCILLRSLNSLSNWIYYCNDLLALVSESWDKEVFQRPKKRWKWMRRWSRSYFQEPLSGLQLWRPLAAREAQLLGSSIFEHHPSWCNFDWSTDRVKLQRYFLILKENSFHIAQPCVTGI